MDDLTRQAYKKMERAAAASRQKSCNACVKGKRRCDKRMPRCTRCAAKGLDCVYQKLPTQATAMAASTATATAAATSTSAAFAVTAGGDFDMGFDMEALQSDTSPESLQSDVSCTTLQMDPSLDFSIMDMLEPGAGSELWQLQGYGESTKLDLPAVPIPGLVPNPGPGPGLELQPMRDVALLAPSKTQCLMFSPLDVHDPRSRLGFIVGVMRSMHGGFAATRTLPFLHPRLYGVDVPRTVLTAFSAAAAYAGASADNRLWVVRLINDAAREVALKGGAAETPADKLARLQAALVLDVIRMFDGDVGLRADAEKDMARMVDWLKALGPVKAELQEGLGAASPASRDRPPKSWEAWILLESLRRTVMMALIYICLVSIIKSQEPPCELFGCDHSFTASRHLWEATSPAEFFRAWREKPQWCINDMDFDDFWIYARPDDLDEFTRIMLTGQAGPDLIEQFMMGTATAF